MNTSKKSNFEKNGQLICKVIIVSCIGVIALDQAEDYKFHKQVEINFDTETLIFKELSKADTLLSDTLSFDEIHSIHYKGEPFKYVVFKTCLDKKLVLDVSFKKVKEKLITSETPFRLSVKNQSALNWKYIECIWAEKKRKIGNKNENKEYKAKLTTQNSAIVFSRPAGEDFFKELKKGRKLPFNYYQRKYRNTSSIRCN